MVEVMLEKDIVSITMNRRLNKKVTRLANILDISRSQFIEDVCHFYIAESDVCKKAGQRIRADKKLLDRLKQKGR